MVDTAFVRPGRFDRVVHVVLPSKQERISILGLHIRRMKWTVANDSPVLDLICEKIAARTEGFSGADLATLCRAAAVRCLLEDLEDGASMEERHFTQAQENGVSASSSGDLVERIRQWSP